MGKGEIQMKTIKKAINDSLKLNLQFFAEGEDNPQDQDTGDSGEVEVEEVTLSAEELQKKIESESDRKLAKVLEKKQKEWQEKQEQAIQEALERHERLSKLSEKERKEQELSEKEKELQKRIAEIERKELKADAVADLSEKGLPAEFADFLLADNAENTLENINTFKKAFDEAVNAAVKEQLRQETPKAGATTLSKGVPSLSELAEKARKIK